LLPPVPPTAPAPCHVPAPAVPAVAAEPNCPPCPPPPLVACIHDPNDAAAGEPPLLPTWSLLVIARPPAPPTGLVTVSLEPRMLAAYECEKNPPPPPPAPPPRFAAVEVRAPEPPPPPAAMPWQSTEMAPTYFRQVLVPAPRYRSRYVTDGPPRRVDLGP